METFILELEKKIVAIGDAALEYNEKLAKLSKNKDELPKIEEIREHVTRLAKQKDEVNA